jgi:nucleotide-binding universal stress UspA family protein
MKILLPVSSAGVSGDTLRLAVDTALSLGGGIRGLAMVDIEGIRRTESGAPPGAIYLARLAEKRLAERETAGCAAALEKAAAAFREAGVPFAGEVVAGDPRKEMEKASAACDLLVAGIASRFAYGQSDEPGKTVLSLLKGHAIPLLLAASPYRPVQTVVVGCGGGDRTSRAVGALTRLNLWKSGFRMILLAVAGSPEEGEARLAPARRILAEAGYPAPEERVRAGLKTERFPDFCEKAGADAAVLGGWGEHRWDDFLGLSVTGRMIERNRLHLFLYM